MPNRRLIFLTLTAAALTRAQEPLNPPVPLAPAPPALSAGQAGLSLVAGRQAEELGFPSVAAEFYEQLLAAPGTDRRALTLALATARLDEGNPDAALKALNGMAAPHTSAWHLRAGLAYAALGQMQPARNESAAVRAGELSAEDRPWGTFLLGLLARSAGEFPRAVELFGQAESQAAAGGTNLTRARFQLARDQADLQLDHVTPEEAEQARRNAESNPGSVGYEFERSYAVMLNALGRTPAAIEALQGDLLTLPAREHARADDFRLLLGMIAGAGSRPGRTALFQLLETGVDLERQRQALQLLARGLAAGPDRAAFRAELDKLIAGAPPHPILDDLLLVRAEWALGDKDYARAEDSASALLDRFPGSPLKPYALGDLTRAAWEQQHYRTAANYARQTRDLVPDGAGDSLGVRSQLNLAVAEAWYRARDYRNAADAYASVVRSPPPGVRPGDLMFQRVEAEIKAGALNEAAGVLDEEARSPQFDAVSRWEAEWNLSRALELANRSAEAYDRVNRLLSGRPSPGLSAELRARMAWLQARLAVDARDEERALKLVDGLGQLLSGLDPALREEIASGSLLLKAQTSFDLKRETDALSILKQLRAEYPDSDAAAKSYFDEANYDERQDKLVEAQQLLTGLADKFPHSAYAPYALYQAATMAERLGRDQNLKEADRLLDRIATNYPDDTLVFDARMKQGDVLGELDQFPQAQQAYESLVKNPAYAGTPNAIIAQLALARCDNAQSAGGKDFNHQEQARGLFEDLCDRVDAPPDVRVEAGFNLGLIYMSGGRLQQARDVWWGDVVSKFLLSGGQGAQLGEKGRYWMAKTLFALADLFEQQGEADQAVQAWQLVIKKGLPFAALAQSDLANLNSPHSRP
ncbi:MAG: tetratricopeptide repeat protein [Opitutaceae bacterium]|jgi:TolA-binding protein